MMNNEITSFALSPCHSGLDPESISIGIDAESSSA